MSYGLDSIGVTVPHEYVTAVPEFPDQHSVNLLVMFFNTLVSLLYLFLFLKNLFSVVYFF